MSKRKLPDTSLSAYDSVKGECINNHHLKILAAFEEVEMATYEQIATKTKLDRHAVGRRLSELALAEKIYRTEIKLPTSTGRLAYAFAKVGAGIPKAEEKPKRKSKQELAPDKKTIVVREHTRQLKKEDLNSNMNPLFELE